MRRGFAAWSTVATASVPTAGSATTATTAATAPTIAMTLTAGSTAAATAIVVFERADVLDKVRAVVHVGVAAALRSTAPTIATAAAIVTGLTIRLV